MTFKNTKHNRCQHFPLRLEARSACVVSSPKEVQQLWERTRLAARAMHANIPAAAVSGQPGEVPGEERSMLQPPPPQGPPSVGTFEWTVSLFQ